MKPSRQPATARVFFALWPTAAEQAQLTAWQLQLKPLCGGRVMRDQTLHATLIFIGSVASGRLEALQQAAREVCAEDFELRLDQARYWGHNHIVYAAPSDTPQPLVQLVDTLAQHLEAHGFKFDRRDYRPHVTLVRKARCNDATLPAMPPANWQIHDFALMQSTQWDGLPEYRVLARFPLRAGGG